MHHYHVVIRVLAILQTLCSIFLLKWGIKPTRFSKSSLKLEFSVFSFTFFKLKNIFCSFQLFANGHIHNVSTLIKALKLDVESKNVI